MSQARLSTTGYRMPSFTPDVIDLLVGIEPGSPLDTIRAARQQACDNAQASYVALFEPTEVEHVSLAERFALATFVTGLHRQETELNYYRRGLKRADEGLVAKVEAEISNGLAEGPAGAYPPGPLSAEDTPAPSYTPADAAALGPRLAAAFTHAHMLVFHPRDAKSEHIGALLAAGWSATGIVTLSQIVAFLAFQLRVIHGLRVLSRNLAK